MVLDAVWSGNRRWWTIGAAVVIVALATWLLWPSPPEPRAREYSEYTACLVTDEHGIAGPEAAAIWSGIEKAALRARVQAEYVAVSGEQTATNALTYLNGMAQGHCDLIFAAGPTQREAVRQGAHRFPGVRFYVVGGSDAGANVVRLDGDPAAAAERIVTDAAADAGMAPTS